MSDDFPRYTEWVDRHVVVKDEFINPIYKLAYYEDTGLLPGQIHILKNWYEFRTDKDFRDSRRLIELAAADGEGRVVIFPSAEEADKYRLTSYKLERYINEDNCWREWATYDDPIALAEAAHFLGTVGRDIRIVKVENEQEQVDFSK